MTTPTPTPTTPRPGITRASSCDWPRCRRDAELLSTFCTVHQFAIEEMALEIRGEQEWTS